MNERMTLSDWIRKNKEAIASVLRFLNFCSSLLIVVLYEAIKIKKRRRAKLEEQAFSSENYEKKVKALKKLLKEEL